MREYKKFVSRGVLKLMSYSGCEPLTPEDIAEVIVFTAGRRENVVVADTLVFPNHQVCESYTTRVRQLLAPVTTILLLLYERSSSISIVLVADCLIKAAATVMLRKS